MAKSNTDTVVNGILDAFLERSEEKVSSLEWLDGVADGKNRPSIAEAFLKALRASNRGGDDAVRKPAAQRLARCIAFGDVLRSARQRAEKLYADDNVVRKGNAYSAVMAAVSAAAKGDDWKKALRDAASALNKSDVAIRAAVIALRKAAAALEETTVDGADEMVASVTDLLAILAEVASERKIKLPKAA